MPEWLFQRWQDFFAAEPFGDAVQNLMLAQVAAAIFQSRGAKDLRARHFLPGEQGGDEEDEYPSDDEE